MLRSLTYAVWRGTNNPRLLGQPTTSLTQNTGRHPYSVNITSAPEQETDETSNNERLSGNDIVTPNFINRNPRNLERMAVARKDKGWGCSRTRKDYWHKLHFEKSTRHVTAYVQHFNGNIVVSASTKEWAIKKYLYNTSDVSSAENIGHVLAQRCLESGISYVHWDVDDNIRTYERTRAFVAAMKDGGVILNEPKMITDFKKSINYFPHIE